MSGRRNTDPGRRSGAGRERLERSAPEVSLHDLLSPAEYTRASAAGDFGYERRNPRRSAREPQSRSYGPLGRPWTRQSGPIVRGKKDDQRGDSEEDLDDDLPLARRWAPGSRRAKIPVKDEESDVDEKKNKGRSGLRNTAARDRPSKPPKETVSAPPTTQRHTSERNIARPIDHAETYAPATTRRRASERNAVKFVDNAVNYSPPIVRRRNSERSQATLVDNAGSSALPSNQRRTSGRIAMRPVNYAEAPSSPMAGDRNNSSSFPAAMNDYEPQAPLSPLYERPPRTRSQEAYLRSSQSFLDIEAFHLRMQQSADTVLERRHGYSRNVPSAGRNHGAGYPVLTGHVGVATPVMRNRGVDTFFGMMNTAAREDPASRPSARGERVIPMYVPPEKVTTRHRQRKDNGHELERRERHEERGRHEKRHRR